MSRIFKTKKKATYFEGVFYLRNENTNASPINYPTVFTAYGAAIKNGNWRSCTSINTPQFVIDNYFDGNKNIYGLGDLWNKCFELEKLTWQDVKEDKTKILSLINAANNELLKLVELI